MWAPSFRSVAIAFPAAAVATAVTLPAVWWEPLHLDERVTLEFAPRSPPTIVREIFVERGGAPLQFLVEHVTLSWPGGVEGLRLPSLLFFLLALACAAPVARALAGEGESIAVPLLLALAPLAVELATFARMYALFLWLVLATAWLALRAGALGTRSSWVAAGVLAGALVYVHPIAPVYAIPALACGLAASQLPLRAAAVQALPAVAAAVAVALPYAYALAVLRSRYGVGEAGPIETTAGRSVPEEALYALTARGTLGAALLTLVAAVGTLRLWRRRPRSCGVVLFWLALPVAFFTVVPAETRFFGRYVVAALPPFLILVASGCLALARGRAVAAVALVAAVLVLEGADDADRLRSLSDLRLSALPATVDGDVVFSSTGSPRSDRPPELLDDLVLLEHPGTERVEELPAIDPRFEEGLLTKGRREVRAFLSTGEEARGVWLFRGRPHRVRTAEGRIARIPELKARRIGNELLVVSSRARASPRRLVELGILVRQAWGLTTPADRWPRLLVAIDRSALARR